MTFSSFPPYIKTQIPKDRESYSYQKRGVSPSTIRYNYPQTKEKNTEVAQELPHIHFLLLYIWISLDKCRRSRTVRSFIPRYAVPDTWSRTAFRAVNPTLTSTIVKVCVGFAYLIKNLSVFRPFQPEADPPLAEKSRTTQTNNFPVYLLLKNNLATRY